MKPREKHVSHPRCIGIDRCARYNPRLAPLGILTAPPVVACAHMGYFGECRREKGPEGKKDR